MLSLSAGLRNPGVTLVRAVRPLFAGPWEGDRAILALQTLVVAVTTLLVGLRRPPTETLDRVVLSIGL